MVESAGWNSGNTVATLLQPALRLEGGGRGGGREFRY
jgi:hypothetical protein